VDVIDTATGPVHSLSIEEVLLADCDEIVRDCSVVGVPNGAGLAPVAVVCPPSGAGSWSEETILERANKELARAGLAQLAAVRIAREPVDFPLGPTGKVLKRELRTRYASMFATV
jgi:acyl-CoA synthetase (AMP-forming)/AMP-acid ligase II